MSRITKKAHYGQHIDLTCKNHPDLSWSTKNIDGIGCRTIFYNLACDDNMPNECDCTNKFLTISPRYNDMPDVAEQF